MRRSLSTLFFGVLAAPLLLIAGNAMAAPDRSSCGNIDLLATGDCHLDVTGGCTAKCEPLSFEAACNGNCDISVDVSCSGSCNTQCVADCELQPAQFDCTASCRSDCEGSCDGRCSTDADQTTCSSFCKESCQTNCQAQCKAVPPKADCQAQCQGCCTGSCTSQANFDCSYKCTADLKGGCEADCKAPDGALFCKDQNGVDQYVHVGNLDDCVAFLESQYNITIDYQASGTCDNSGCQGTASASVGCAAAPVGSAPFDVGAIAAMAVGVGLIATRRRRA